jgi:hypothetical protein
MIRECLATMESGDIEDLFEIIPRIGVLRDSCLTNPLSIFLLTVTSSGVNLPPIPWAP